MEGYRPMRNYTNKSMGWLTYIEKTLNINLKHAWNGGDVYLKDADVWADVYYEKQHWKTRIWFYLLFLSWLFKVSQVIYEES